MVEACHCGTYSVAKCVRCGQPRCGTHYILGYKMTSDGYQGFVTTPNGTGLTYLSGSTRYVTAHIGGGPGCDVCRDAAGKAADAAFNDIMDERRADAISALLGSPSMAAVRTVLAALSRTPANDAEAAAVLPRIDQVIRQAADTEVLVLDLAQHPRFGSKLMSRKEPVINIAARLPAVTRGADWIACTGEQFHRSSEHALPVMAQRTWVAVQAGGKVPPTRYSPPAYGWDSDSPAYWSIEGRLSRQPFPTIREPTDPATAALRAAFGRANQ